MKSRVHMSVMLVVMYTYVWLLITVKYDFVVMRTTQGTRTNTRKM